MKLPSQNLLRDTVVRGENVINCHLYKCLGLCLGVKEIRRTLSLNSEPAQELYFLIPKTNFFFFWPLYFLSSFNQSVPFFGSFYLPLVGRFYHALFFLWFRSNFNPSHYHLVLYLNLTYPLRYHCYKLFTVWEKTKRTGSRAKQVWTNVRTYSLKTLDFHK